MVAGGVYRYEVRLVEELSETARWAFPSLEIHREGDHTVLTGEVADVTELRSLIDRILLMGFTLVALYRLPR